MSEYQFYDFYSIDRPLSREDLETIDGYSSRVKLSSRRASFVYHYSDFRYDEEEVLNDFFDVMLYVANWGSRRLLMKFPSNLVSYQELKQYEIDASYDFNQVIKIFKKGPHVLIDMYHSIEEGGWMDGEGTLNELLPLRSQILNRDYRVLYLGWIHLASVNPEMSSELCEPTVPANLKELDYSLESFVNFWEIDWDLIRAASELSEEEEIITDEDLASQIEHLSDKERNQYLIELLHNEVKAKNELRKRLRELYAGPIESKKGYSRTLAELQAGMANHQKIRLERERLEAEELHRKKMVKIEKEELKMWQEVSENAHLKTSKGYDKATEILKVLKEYYDYKQNQALFDNKLGDFLDSFGKSAAFRRRMQSKGIL